MRRRVQVSRHRCGRLPGKSDEVVAEDLPVCLGEGSGPGAHLPNVLIALRKNWTSEVRLTVQKSHFQHLLCFITFIG